MTLEFTILNALHSQFKRPLKVLERHNDAKNWLIFSDWLQLKFLLVILLLNNLLLLKIFHSPNIAWKSVIGNLKQIDCFSSKRSSEFFSYVINATSTLWSVQWSQNPPALWILSLNFVVVLSNQSFILVYSTRTLTVASFSSKKINRQ